MLNNYSDNQESKYISVSELSNMVKGCVEQSFTTIYLKGEISGIKIASSGHCFFKLKDEYSSINACVWKMNWQKLLSSVGNDRSVFVDGVKVFAECTLSVYQNTTSISVVISKMTLVGKGELAIKFEMLKQKLEQEGLFDQSRKKSLPEYPKVVGIVSADTAAGKGDMVKILHERSPFLKIVLFPAMVQGEKAALSIIKAINCATQHYINNTSLKPDVLIIGRGGGSIEDMWCFNDENLARVIADCPIPTITGVGHEQDFTIADFVADYRASTPSNAAEIVTKNTVKIIDTVNSCKIRIKGKMKAVVDKYVLKLDYCNAENLKKTIENKITLLENNYNFAKQRLYNQKDTIIQGKQHQIEMIAQKLDALSPLKSLSRGYSIVQDKTGKSVTDVAQVAVGDNINIILNKGKIVANIIDTQSNE